jgi:hypothetical protein
MKGSGSAIAIVCKLLFVPIATSVKAGISGDSELRAEVDRSRHGETVTALEQWTSLYYKDLKSDLQMGVQFALQAHEQDSAGQIYQCFVRSGDGRQRPELTVGRFETIDNHGFQTLDGFSLYQQVTTPLAWKFYTGKPRQFEAYQEEDADLLLGLGTEIDLKTLTPTDSFKKLMFNLGLEQRWSYAKQTNLHGSLSGEMPEIDADAQIRDFHLAMDMSLDDSVLRRVMMDANFDFKQQGHLRMAYHYYLPDDDLETFRDRYHGFYSMDRQSILKSIWFLPKTGAVETRFEISGSRQEQGNGGLGLATEWIYSTHYGSIWDGRIDYLEVAHDQAVSIYLRYQQPLSSQSKFELEGVYQTKQTQLSGSNHMNGFSFSLAQRLIKQVTLNLSGEWLDHSEREDEYRFGASIHYEFYQTNTGELP